MTNTEIDAELGNVLAKHAAWKSVQLSRIAAAIVKAALSSEDGNVWPDDPQVNAIAETIVGNDKNCIGTAWRWLGRAGVMTRGMARRRSTAGSSKGREIAEWRIANRAIAQSFLSRNNVKYEPPQRDLFS